MAKPKIPSWSFDPDAIDTGGNVTLVVARRVGKNLRGNRVSIHSDVAEELRVACTTTLTTFKGRTARVFDPDAFIENDEYLIAADAAVDTDAQTKKLLAQAGGLAFLQANELPRRGFLFYAVLVGSKSDDRSAFIRLYNPRRIASGGRFWTVFGEDLRKLEDPIFVFDPMFDMVLTKDGIAALNQKPFERIFRDLSVMRGRLPDYVEHITDKLPMADEDALRFLTKCAQNSRVANRARSIFERGHLANVTIAEVRAEIKRQKLDEKRLLKDDKLVFDDADPYTLLKLLNEDLFIGGLSRTRYEADRKSAR